jgi:hypothetical protein
MTYIQYIPQSCRKEKNNVYQQHSNNIHQLYNKISMPPVGFEPTVLAGEQPQTYTFDFAATVTGTCIKFSSIYLEEYLCLWLNMMCVLLCQNSYSDGFKFQCASTTLTLNSICHLAPPTLLINFAALQVLKFVKDVCKVLQGLARILTVYTTVGSFITVFCK